MAINEKIIVRPLNSEIFNPINHELFSLRKRTTNLFEGKLVYRICDGIFFVMVDTNFINIGNKYLGDNKPKALINRMVNNPDYMAHITLNKRMKKIQSTKIFKELFDKFGLDSNPISNNPEIICLNKIIEFDIIGAYVVNRKTKNYIVQTKQLLVSSETIKEMDEKYSFVNKNSNYTHHITVSEYFDNIGFNFNPQNLNRIFNNCEIEEYTGVC